MRSSDWSSDVCSSDRAETRCADDTGRTVVGSRRLCAASGTFAIVAVTAGPTLRQPACAANAMPIMARSGRVSFTSPLKAAHQNQYERAAKTTRVLIGQGSVGSASARKLARIVRTPIAPIRDRKRVVEGKK